MLNHRIIVWLTVLMCTYGYQSHAEGCQAFQPQSVDGRTEQAAYDLAYAKCQKTAAAVHIVLNSSTFGQLPTVILELLQRLSSPERQKIVKQHQSTWLKIRLGLHEREEREALATIALQYMTIAGSAEMVYGELADTDSAQRRYKNKYVKTFSRDIQLKRLRTLQRAHLNDQVLKLAEELMPKKWVATDESCELRYTLGKTYRKIRHYQKAEDALFTVQQQCEEPWKMKAHYMRARVTSFRKKTELRILDSFISAYPEETLTDDVMVWKAKTLLKNKKNIQAEAVFRTAYETYPSGDMNEYARFQYAFRQASRGAVEEAINALLSGLNDTRVSLSVLGHDQFQYWIARLKAFPSLKNFSPNIAQQQYLQGLCGLSHLATNRPASYYGRLAKSLLVKEKNFDFSQCPNLDDGFAQRFFRGKQQQRASQGYLNNISLDEYAALFEAGFVGLAERLLRRLSVKNYPLELVSKMAQMRRQAGNMAGGHQVYRRAGFALLPEDPSRTYVLSTQHKARPFWEESYPLVYREAFEQAMAKHNGDPDLLQGLSREESAFNASVISWAGATGLCQLMPRTAAEEARLGKLPDSTPERLKEPFYNAQLGANHLMRRLNGLKHPFLAIAAYNAGPGNVKKWRTTQYPKTIDAWVESIPVEQTRKYVKKVVGSWQVYKQLYKEKDADIGALILP